MSVVTRIKQALSVNQTQLAAIVGKNQATISRWEKGLGLPTIEDISKIRSEFLRRNLEWNDEIVFGSDDAPEHKGDAAA